MRKYLYAVAVGVTALFTAGMMSGTAFAASAVLTDPAGNVSVGAVITGTQLGSATFADSTGTKKVSCASGSYKATVTSNPSAPGTATEALTNQTFNTCTSSGLFCVSSISGVHVDNLAYNTSVDSSLNVTVSPGSAGPIQTSVTVNSCLGPITCVYQSASGSLHGTANNAANSITFANQQFNLSSGPATVCFSPAFFTATYAPNSDANGAVQVN